MEETFEPLESYAEVPINEVLTAAGRWKKRRVAQRWAWKRTRFEKLALHQGVRRKSLKRRSYLGARNVVYRHLLGKRKKSSISFGARASYERIAKRLAPIYVKTGATRSGAASRARDDRRQH